MAAGGAGAYLAFAREVRAATVRVVDDPATADPAAVAGLLDGRAATRLLELVPLERRRRDGIFFTGSAMRDRLLEGWQAPAEGATLDPACGAADLLLAVAARLPLESGLAETVRAWGRRLAGTDVHPAFVEAARARLVLQAAWRHVLRDGSVTGPPPDHDMFPLVRTGDGLAALRRCENDGVTAVVCNPPFNALPAPDNYLWGSGLTTSAAVFADAVVAGLPPGAPFAAVLPDVIRTGSRYDKVRARLETTCDLDRPEVLLPQFDARTDVHVFLLRGRTRLPGPSARRVDWWTADAPETVSSRFRVSVGPVVDNRDPQRGPRLPYLKAAELPIRGEYVPTGRTRRHQGRSVTPPFVVVRRTSRPSRGSARAAGVLVLGDGPVHVDNHLLVAAPIAGGADECRALLVHLDTAFTTDWLDARIRCRHLTVGALKDLPFPP